VKRLLAVASLLAVSPVAARAAATPHPVHASTHHALARPVVPPVRHLTYRVAPADEYFGRLKMSILGIRNALRDMGLKADADPDHATSILGTIALTEDAMRDWERKYPHDTWIPPAILQLERDYAKVDSDDARAHAKVVMVWLVRDYPTSAPGKLGRGELDRNLVGVKPPPVLEAAGPAGPLAPAAPAAAPVDPPAAVPSAVPSPG
jgi:hypothetical protein